MKILVCQDRDDGDDLDTLLQEVLRRLDQDRGEEGDVTNWDDDG